MHQRRIGGFEGTLLLLIFLEHRSGEDEINLSVQSQNDDFCFHICRQKESGLFIELSDLCAVEVDICEIRGCFYDFLSRQIRSDTYQTTTGDPVADIALGAPSIDSESSV